ncbi:polysaccharide deacetylase family protein [Rheinheimera baltica]|uniref:Polysaccharide deacetylase family protein n=2 Tax=Rheinheimera baltica TaxID=67576 RepID=A0ABT9HU95_9GAMM|nr:polysaccharide deacetylase family protein [Rheinheimera baltica]MDP5134691.1 polysaccharide deacetylase family protein [Rheinheimera baltica]MDP5148790.1 polysaccharide deacetylase family protein [Rheinheimera baltica]
MNFKGCSRSAIEVLSGHMALKWQRRPGGVYCFNYHRIGSAADSEFDPNVYSCTPERFEQHLRMYQTNFDVISIDELISLHNSQQRVSERLALLTFDDGYIDNYQLAYPMLKSAGLTAVFFVSTDYIDKPQIPWWDEVGWIVRHSGNASVKLAHWPSAINIVDGAIGMRVRRLLKAVKQDNSLPMEEKLKQVKVALQLDHIGMPEPTELLVNWQQLKEMADNGMHIGSHTLSHNILAHLTPEQQLVELTQSKQRLETMLHREILSVAYPVGGSDTFTRNTLNVAQQAGYKLAFTFIPGINAKLGFDNRYSLCRFSIDENASVWQLKQMVNKSFSFMSN